VAAVDALGAGLPCVLPIGCNLPEVAESDLGVVEPNADAAALAELFGDPLMAASRGERARRLVAERFIWGRIAARTVVVYEGLVVVVSPRVLREGAIDTEGAQSCTRAQDRPWAR